MAKKTRAFLKWIGGKYRIIDTIKKSLPNSNTLIEPFVGSAAVFLNTDYQNYILADSNADLINVFNQLKNGSTEFIDYCKQFFIAKNNSKEVFLAYREIFNTTNDLKLKAALFLYINRHAYNGMIRYNSSGKINVPFGRYTKPYFPAQEMLYFVNKAKTARIYHADFKTTIKKAKAGDVIYCDPPYAALSTTARFVEYNANVFANEQQIELVGLAEDAANKGIIVVISNHDTDFTNTIYKNAKIKRFKVQRLIGCNQKSRRKINEILAVFS